MTKRTGLFVTTAAGALMVGLGYASQAQAADQMATKAPPAAVETGWWQTGIVEIGGRFFLKDQGGATGGNFVYNPGPFQSLGKFYEYRDLRPGPFGEIFLAGGSRDGLYQYSFGAKNIGYRDQSYWFDWSQAGVQYLSLGFDQTPHTYNNNATTIFQGVGSDTLTIDPNVRNQLTTLLGPTNAITGNNSPTAAGRTGIATTIEGNLNSFRLGFDRYNGNVDYRWTPDEKWDVKVDYNITRRDGTQPAGALTYNGVERGGRVVLEVPRPVHDETHNANVNAEYAGVTPWGKKFNVTAGYGFSAYRDDSDAYTFQNPWVVTNDALTPLNNLMSLPPSNTANMFRLNGGLDMPLNSRWVSSLNYTAAQQDQGFLPFTINPAAIVAASIAQGGPPTISGSANLHNNSLLVNNVLTTKWTPELTQTSRYRYYDFDASHDPVTINYFLIADSSNVVGGPINSHGVSYTKQNGSTDFVWRPASYRWLTLGAGGGWEQWDRHWRGHDEGLPDVNVTNEFMGKVFLNAKPWDWSQFRASYMHAERRYDGTYQQNIGGNDTSCEGGVPCTGFRAYDLANRNRDKLNLYLDLYAQNGVVITPTGGFRIDDYSGDIAKNDLSGGLLHDNSWNAGLEVSWNLAPGVTMFGSYTREEGHKEIWVPFTSHSLAVSPPWSAFTDDKIDTFIAGANIVAIPKKLDFKVAYTLMRAKGSLSAPPANLAASFPDQKQTLNRVDVQARYWIDPDFMQRFGFKGETYVKLRYLWEHNDVSDWAAVNWNYMYLFNGDASNNKAVFLGYNNPNYNVHLVAASVGFKW